MPLPCIRSGVAKQCTARCKHSKKRCQSVAAHNCSTCRMHGAKKKDAILSGAKHPNWKSGLYSKETLAAHKKEMADLDLIEEMLKAGGALDNKKRGR